MHFRPAQTTDAAAISAIIAGLSQGFIVNPDGSGAEKFWESVSEKAEAGYIGNERFRYIVAVNPKHADNADSGDNGADSGEIVGFISMRDISHIAHLFVIQQFQGQGLATRLWDQARAYADAAGHTGAFTVKSALPARPVYARFGFICSGDVVQEHGITFQPMQRP